MRKWSIRLVLIAVCFTGVGLALWLSPMMADVRAAHKKVDDFMALDDSRYEHLIALSLQIESSHSDSSWHRFGGIGEPPVPTEFADFGFERLEVREGHVEGCLYWLVDSGAFVRIDLGSKPVKISLVRGDYGDILDEIYPKKESNQ